MRFTLSVAGLVALATNVKAQAACLPLATLFPSCVVSNFEPIQV